MSVSVQVTSELEKNAVLCGEVQGEAYSDGEVWGDLDSLVKFRGRQPNIPTLTEAVSPNA